jgi:hypothetical protein
LEDKFPLAHKYGLFLLDEGMDVTIKKTDLVLNSKPENKIKLSLDEEYQINSIELNPEPDSVQIAFEIMLIKDNGVSANRFNYKIRNFSIIDLELSDILLAEKVTKSDFDLAMKRGDLNILPNPLNEFTTTSDIYIYYEVYNLTLDANNMANFEQRVTISIKDDQSGFKNVIESVTNFLGFESEEDKITLTTNYQSFNKNVPVYFQIDMNKYSKDDYVLTIEVEDLHSNKVTNAETQLRWR